MPGTSDLDQMPILIDESEDERDDSSESEDYEENGRIDAVDATERLKAEANLMVGAGRYADAIRSYERALEINKSNDEEARKNYYIILKNNIAFCHLQRKNYNEALESALDAIKCGSKNCKSFCRASKAFIGLSQPENAFISLKKGLDVVRVAETETLRKEIQSLKEKYPRIESKIQETSWKKINLDAIAKRTKPYSGKQMSVESEVNEESSDEEVDIQVESKATTKSGSPKKSKSKSAARKQKKKAAEVKTQTPEPVQVQKPSEVHPERVEEQAVESKPKEVCEEEKIQDQFNQLIKDGSIALREKVANTSSEYMWKALEILRNKYHQLKWRDVKEENNLDIVAIKYVYGRACVETSKYDNIVRAKQIFDDILTIYKSVRFPAVHLGYGRLYSKLNRFDEAKKSVQNGLAYLDKNLPFSTCNWPGLPTTPIEETIRENLHNILTELLTELKQPHSPDAVCRFQDCLTQQNHILPSENIFLSDPDYRGHYRIQCRENCRLEYHKVCWGALKGKLQETWKLPNLPSERDILGKYCLTPDCHGIITAVHIFDQNGDKKSIDDAKLLKKLSDEEKKKKEEEKQKREEEQRNAAAKHETKKKKKQRKSPTPDEELNTKENVPVKENSGEPRSYIDHQIDYSQVDLSNATVVRKNKVQNQEAVVEEEDHHKKKKVNKKTVLSLEEFRGSSNNEKNPLLWPGNQPDTDGEDFASRVARAEALKKFSECSQADNSSTADRPTYNVGDKENKIFQSRENRPFLGDNFQSVWSVTGGKPSSTGDLGKKSGKSSGDACSQQNAVWSDKGLLSSATYGPDAEIIKESLWTYLEQVLKEHGPLRYDDPRVLENMSEDSLPIIGGKENIQEFVMIDPKGRFKTSRQYISLLCDLKKAIEMGIEDSNKMEQDKVSLLTDNKRGPGSKLLEDKAWNDLKKKLQTQTSLSQHTSRQNRGSMHSLNAGVQTDISAIDLDEDYDPLTLQQMNTELVEELQDTKDKLTKIQNDKKIEMKELLEKNKNMTDEISRLKNEAQKLRDENFKVKRQMHEAGEKDKEMKTLQLELAKTKKELDQEQRLSFEWRTKGKGLEDEIMNSKRESVFQEHRFYSYILEQHKEQNMKTIAYLEELRHNPRFTSISPLIEKAMKECDEQAARLLATTDRLSILRDNCLRGLSAGGNPKFEFDLKEIAAPDVVSEVLGPLIEAGSTLPPPQTFNPLIAPPSRSIPRFNGPPPGIMLPPRIHNQMNADRVGSRPPGIPRAPDTVSKPSTGQPSVRPPPPLPGQNAFDFNPPPFQTVREPPAEPEPSNPPSRMPVSNSALNRSSTSSPFFGVSTAAAAAAPAAPAAPPVNGASSTGGSTWKQDESVSAKPRKSHDILVGKLCVKFSLASADAIRYTYELREKNGGKLSGMSLQEIFNGVEKMIQEEETKDCVICYEELESQEIRTIEPCQHKYHKGCIDKWLNQEKSGNLCPMCRNYVAKVDEYPELNFAARKTK